MKTQIDARKKESYKIFDSIAPTYDSLNHILSLGIDILWRKRLTKKLPEKKNLFVVDLATGTGDVALHLSQEKNIQEEEKKLINQKKLISAEEYKKKVKDLRNKVSILQKDRNKLFDDVAKQRAKARTALLKNLNPIIQEYMQKNKIRMVIDKKSILLADDKLDITKQIVEILNNKLKSIKLD